MSYFTPAEVNISSGLVKTMTAYRDRLLKDIKILNSTITNYRSCIGYFTLLEIAEKAKQDLIETEINLEAVERFLNETAFNLGDKVAVKDTTVFCGLRKGQLGDIVEVGEELNLANQKIKVYTKVYTIEFKDNYQQNITEDLIHDYLIKVFKEE